MPFAVKFRSAFGYDPAPVSDATALECPADSRTKQSFRDECDINVMMDRFGQGYQMPPGVRAPMYGDFTHVSDFQSAMNAIAGARESFDALPAAVRARFQNDPGEFVAFCSDEANKEDVRKMGLLRPVEASPAVSGGSSTPAPAPAPAAAPAAAPGAPAASTS